MNISFLISSIYNDYSKNCNRLRLAITITLCVVKTHCICEISIYHL